jgi:CheY-like chemotaxis protein
LERHNLTPVFIAVIDDEADLAYLFKEALSQIDGVQVFAFTDPLLALEHFKANHQNYMVIMMEWNC